MKMKAGHTQRWDSAAIRGARTVCTVAAIMSGMTNGANQTFPLQRLMEVKCAVSMWVPFIRKKQ